MLISELQIFNSGNKLISECVLKYNIDFIGVPNKVATDGKRSTLPLSTSSNTTEILQVPS